MVRSADRRVRAFFKPALEVLEFAVPDRVVAPPMLGLTTAGTSSGGPTCGVNFCNLKFALFSTV